MRRSTGAIVLSLWLVAGCPKSAEGPSGDHDAALDDAASPDTAIADAGGPLMHVVGVLVPDEACVFDPDGSFLLKGSFDVGASVDCHQPYTMALLLHNYTQGESPPDGFVGISEDAAQVTEATITLWNTDDTLLNTAPHANPFTRSLTGTLTTLRNGEPGRGIVLVEAIPSELRQTLEPLASRGGTIFVEVALSVSTVAGQQIDLTSYRFPVQLCGDCQRFCSSTLSPSEIDDLTVGECVDNAGADGRVCIDHGC